MPVHLDFDEKWLDDYCKRTGQTNPLDNTARTKKPKYGNKKTKVDGNTYDSKREAARHSELALMQKAGEIYAWAEQVTFLLPGGVKYRADFVVLQRDGTYRIEDSKGVRAKDYLIKRKLMASIGLKINEV